MFVHVAYKSSYGREKERKTISEAVFLLSVNVKALREMKDMAQALRNPVRAQMSVIQLALSMIASKMAAVSMENVLPFFVSNMSTHIHIQCVCVWLYVCVSIKMPTQSVRFTSVRTLI